MICAIRFCFSWLLLIQKLSYTSSHVFFSHLFCKLVRGLLCLLCTSVIFQSIYFNFWLWTFSIDIKSYGLSLFYQRPEYLLSPSVFLGKGSILIKSAIFSLIWCHNCSINKSFYQCKSHLAAQSFVVTVFCSILCADCAILALQWREGLTCAVILLVTEQAFLVK